MYSHFFPAFFVGQLRPPSFRAELHGVMGRNVYGAVEALSREISCQKRRVPLERGISPLCFAAAEMTMAAGRSRVISEETG